MTTFLLILYRLSIMMTVILGILWVARNVSVYMCYKFAKEGIDIDYRCSVSKEMDFIEFKEFIESNNVNYNVIYFKDNNNAYINSYHKTFVDMRNICINDVRIQPRTMRDFITIMDYLITEVFSKTYIDIEELESGLFNDCIYIDSLNLLNEMYNMEQFKTIKDIRVLTMLPYFKRYYNKNTIYVNNETKVINLLHSGNYREAVISAILLASDRDFINMEDKVRYVYNEVISICRNLGDKLDKELSSIIFEQLLDEKLIEDVINRIEYKLDDKYSKFIDNIDPRLVNGVNTCWG